MKPFEWRVGERGERCCSKQLWEWVTKTEQKETEHMHCLLANKVLSSKDIG